MFRCSRLGDCLAALLLGLLTSIASAAPEVLIDAQFGIGGAAPVATAPAAVSANARITGQISQGWGDNSGFNDKLQLDYSVQKDGTHTFQHMDKPTLDGRGQLVCYLPRADLAAGFYQWTATYRASRLTEPVMMLRVAPVPYTALWQFRLETDGQWHTSTHTFSLPASKAQTGIWINLEGQGTLDVESVRLVRYTREELIAEMSRTAAPAIDGNLLAYSHFPLGLPSGWTLGRDDSELDVTVKSDDTGALCIDAPHGMRVYSAPLPIVRRFEPHTLSLSLRGSGKGKLVITADGDTLAEKAFTLDDARTPLELTFNPSLADAVHSFRIEAMGTLYLDALQLDDAPQASVYAPARPEVALGLPPSDASLSHVQFTDEPAKFLAVVSGTYPKDAVLKSTLTPIDGPTVTLPDRTPADHNTAVYTAGPLLGTFRISAWLASAASESLTAPVELIVHRLPRPRHWGEDAPDSPFGVHTEPAQRHLLMAKAIGANWVRLHDAGMRFLHWQNVEPEKGQWVFYDREIQRYRDAKLKILGSLGTAPYWATGYDRSKRDEYWTGFTMPRDLDEYANYVSTIVKRYQGVIDTWETWNEPWGDFLMNWDPVKKQRYRSPTDMKDYADLQAATWKAATAIDPNLHLLGFNTLGPWHGPAWTTGVLAAGGLPTCNVFTFHQYTTRYNGFPGDDVSTTGLTPASKPIVDREGKLPMPAWMTEGGVNTYWHYDGFYLHTLPWIPRNDARDQANRLTRYILSELAQGCQKIFLYSMHCHNTFSGKTFEYTSLVAEDGSLEPSGAAFAILTWNLEDTHFIKTIQLAPGNWAYLFQGKTESVAVLSTAPGHAAYTPPANLPATDMFGNPVPPASQLGEEPIYLRLAGQVQDLESALVKR